MENEDAPDAATDGQPPLGKLRAGLAIEQAHAAQLRRELIRNELATASAFEKLDRANARANELEARVRQEEAAHQALRERVAALEASLHQRTETQTAEIEASRAKLTAAAVPAPPPAPPQPSAVARPLGGLLARLPGWARGRASSDRSPALQNAPPLMAQRAVVERSGMFDPDWYRRRYPEVDASRLAPLDHFLTIGWRERKDPAPGFSTQFYLENNADVQSSGMNPLYHYVVIGRFQGRPPSEDAKYVEGIDQAAVIADEFDDEFYRAKSGLPLARPQALEHYLRKGWKEGLDPHPQFSTKFYLRTNADVWRTGINPYLHYILSGRREGRLPREFPGLSDDLLDQWRTIAREFDVAFYRSKYADVVERRFEPILHYVLEGWRRDYDPHPHFSTSHYLDEHPDVRQAGINPYVHYLAEGRREGRALRPAGSWTSRSNLRSTVAAEFDADFYRARNPDIVEAKADPLEHFLDYGWKEGRDPNPDFSTRHYLESNTDVAAAGVNPFYHYLVAGRSEDREAVHPGGWRALALQRLMPLDKQIEEAARTAPPFGPVLEGEALVAAFDDHDIERLIFSFSQDDYTTSVGGVQLCLKLEEEAARERGFLHLNVHPALPSSVLSRDTTGGDNILVITCNGKRLGAAWASELQRALVELSNRIKQSFVVVHSLLAHAPETVGNFCATLQPERSFLWLHDFFSICPSFTLMRNGISFCHAPELGSTACMLCAFGDERKLHLARMTKLFANTPFELIAPSKFAAEFWRAKSKLRFERVHVQEHCQLKPKGKLTPGDGPVRVAFLGHPSPHKGWEAFLRLLREVGQDERYEFHHLGAGSKCDRRTVFSQVSVLESGPNAMIDALVAKKIDVAVLWSIWPETFSFVVHEAIGAGVSVLTSADAGNIARIVRDRGCGEVLTDEDALIAAFKEGVVAKSALAARARARTRSEPVFSAMTFGVLEEASSQ